MKKLLLCYLSIFLMGLGSLQAQSTIDFEGEITTDVVWDSNMDTVRIIGDVFIDTLGSLTIESGVVVEFQGSYRFDVESTINANGTESDPIIFTAADTTGYYNYSHEGWLGIDFVNTDANADASTFDYCEFYFGKAGGVYYWDSHGGVIFIENFNKVEITNCVFKFNYSKGNGGAIHVKNADILIQNSILKNNKCEGFGGAINASGYDSTGTASIFNSTFENNIALAGGAVRVRGGGNSLISGNIFQFNEAFDQPTQSGGGGILVTGDPDSTIIENNYIANNNASDGGGIKIAGDSSPILINNIIANNTCSEYEGDPDTGNGGGIKIAYYSTPVIINNTIVNNLADYGGGIFTSCEIDSVEIYNTIIYGNETSGDGAQIYIKTVDDSLHKVEFYNCNIEGDTTDIYVSSGNKSDIVYLNNINESSAFTNPTSGAGSNYETSPEDWKLSQSSPCIDAGDDTDIVDWLPAKDYFGNNRIQGSIIDIGAHEYDASTGIGDNDLSNQGNLKIYPNPASDHVFIEISTNKYNIIEIFDINGKVLISRNFNNEKEQINISELKGGLYFVKVSNQSESEANRLLVK